MSKYKKLTFPVIGICLVLILVFVTRRPKPVEQQIMAAQQIKFLGENFPADGGSRAFFFYLPGRQYLMLQALHRGPTETGGNPDFQQIFIQGYRSHRVEVQPGSELEHRILTLLDTAVIQTNAPTTYPAPPKPERLKWIIDRMRDRKSSW